MNVGNSMGEEADNGDKAYSEGRSTDVCTSPSIGEAVVPEVKEAAGFWFLYSVSVARSSTVD